LLLQLSLRLPRLLLMATPRLLLQVRLLVPESEQVAQLLEYEQRLDAVIERKRVAIQEVGTDQSGASSRHPPSPCIFHLLCRNRYLAILPSHPTYPLMQKHRLA